MTNVWDIVADTWPIRTARALMDAARLPGDVAARKFDIEPTTPGLWSDEDEARLNLTNATLLNRARDLAGMTMSGTLMAPRGAIGSGLTRPPRSSGGPLPMDEASRMARADQYFPVDAYHATLKTFPSFRRMPNDIGVHFGTKGQAADLLARRAELGQSLEGAHIIPARLNIRNPLRLEDTGTWGFLPLAVNLKKTGRFTEEEILGAVRGAATTSERSQIVALRKLIESKDYDGIVYKNLWETAGGEELRKGTNSLRELAYKLHGKDPASVWHPRETKSAAFQAWQDAKKEYNAFRINNAEDSYAIFHPRQARSRNATFDPSKLGSANLMAGIAGTAALPTALLADALMRWRPRDIEE